MILASQTTILFAILLSLFAGLTTVIGSLIAFFAKKTNTKLLCYALSFSGGAMLMVSLGDLVPDSVMALKENFSFNISLIYSVCSFLIGVLFIFTIEKLLFKDEGDIHKGFPHKTLPDLHFTSKKMNKLKTLSVLAVCVHNFPEGMATFFSALEGTQLGYSVAIAIALHNIPEGITISVPVFYTTGSRFKAVFVAFLASLAEPVGAILGYLIIGAILPPILSPLVFSFAAGMMVFIALEELIPTSREYGGGKEVIVGILLGMTFIAIGGLFK